MEGDHREKLLSFYDKHRRMPGYKELMELTGFKSKNAIYKLINRLVEAGVVAKDKQGKLIPTTSFGEVPFVGLVEAGMPTAAEEQDLDTMSLDKYLVPHKDKTYILEVKGDSMIEEGIKEGDLVIVERRGEAREGDIVIAEVDGGWTMKYFRRRGNDIYLEPANRRYKPIYPTESFRIAAIVKGVIRKY